MGVDSKNPKLWRELQEPHESVEAMNSALDGFIAGVGGLREKFRIADVLTVCRVSYQNEQGEELEALMPHHYGELLRAEGMAAMAYGTMAKTRQEQISRFMSGTVLNAQKNRP